MSRICATTDEGTRPCAGAGGRLGRPRALARPGLQRPGGRCGTVGAVSDKKGDVMADRALFIGFGEPVRGREERAVEVFGEFVDMCGRMQSDGRIEGMDVALAGPARR